MQPNEFLELGGRLIDESASAETRTGVSRLYFANHLVAIARATSHWGYVPTESGDDHGRLIKFMKDRGGRFRDPAEQLRRLRNARAHADYHLTQASGCPYCELAAEDCEFTRRDAEQLRLDAEALFRRLSSL
ncbi:hypothetical protein ACNOYE_04665 [Nannocystaceae bacterium ST9]